MEGSVRVGDGGHWSAGGVVIAQRDRRPRKSACVSGSGGGRAKERIDGCSM